MGNCMSFNRNDKDNPIQNSGNSNQLQEVTMAAFPEQPHPGVVHGGGGSGGDTTSPVYQPPPQPPGGYSVASHHQEPPPTKHIINENKHKKAAPIDYSGGAAGKIRTSTDGGNYDHPLKWQATPVTTTTATKHPSNADNGLNQPALPSRTGGDNGLNQPSLPKRVNYKDDHNLVTTTEIKPTTVIQQETSNGFEVVPRPFNTKDKKVSLDPSKEKYVRDIELKFEDVYKIGKTLGSGAFAVVMEVTHKQTSVTYAAKKIDKSKMKWGDRDALKDEIQNLREVKDGPNIVQLFEVYDKQPKPNNKFCILIMECLKGGELFDRIIKKTQYTEKEARDTTKCLLNALSYMHKRRICHRDLKPENLLLVSKNNDTEIKLADFGFAKKLKNPNSCRTLCGTPGYLAPEILERWPSYDVGCDVWSVGVILFLLIGGYLPFDDDDEDMVFEKTRNGVFTFHRKYFSNASKEVKDLISKMLTVNTKHRITIDDALNHKWTSYMSEAQLRRQNLTNTISVLSETFDGKKKLRVAVQGLIMMNRLDNLKGEFNKYLENKDDGTIVTTDGNINTYHYGKTNNTIANFKDDESQTGQPYKDFYTNMELLGEGGFAQVFLSKHKKTGKEYATKVINMKMLHESDAERALSDEISSLKLLRNGPHIIRLYDVFENETTAKGNFTYLILELMKGGELLDRIVDKEVYTEREARRVCRFLFNAIDYCHKKHIAHRDLKPENLLLVEKNNDTTIKIADFGFARKCTKPNELKTLCGTANYVAPEVINIKKSKGYDQRCDMWSIGVIIYILLGGYAPFEADDFEDLAPLILRGKYEFHDEFWSDISPEAKKLIKQLLQVNPNKRISAERAMQNEWMIIDGEHLARKDLSVAQTHIKSKFVKDKFKGAVKAVMAMNKLHDSIGDDINNLALDDEDIKEAIRLQKEDQEQAKNTLVGEQDNWKTFDQVYEWGDKIHGLSSNYAEEIHESKNRQTGRTYTVRRIFRKALETSDAVALHDEINALKAVQGSPYIVKLYNVFEEPDYTYLVEENFQGGDLIKRIITKSSYNEKDAREVCRALLRGVEYIHSKGIANRNLKPDNLYLVSEESDTDIKIANFGFAKKVLYPNSLRTQCGTEGYVAPEVLEHHPAYDTKCDMWSLGVIVYILLGGYRPFRGSGDLLMRQIRYGEYEFHKRYWDHVSDGAKNLIRGLLTVNPTDRLSASEALEGEWMNADDETLQSYSLDNNLGQMKENFEPKKRFRQSVKAIMAAQKLQSLIDLKDGKSL